jgi:Flp pilus assembly pilin Flp
MMTFSKESLRKERGQGLVEYSLIVLLVVLVFWFAVKGTGVGPALAGIWSAIDACAGSPFSCGSGS